jgi:hypothetical protein
VVIADAVGTVSFGQLPLSEHETLLLPVSGFEELLLPQPANAITVTVIAAKRISFISCPSKFDLARCGSGLNSGAHLTLPGEAAQGVR